MLGIQHTTEIYSTIQYTHRVFYSQSIAYNTDNGENTINHLARIQSITYLLRRQYATISGILAHKQNERDEAVGLPNAETPIVSANETA